MPDRVRNYLFGLSLVLLAVAFAVRASASQAVGDGASSTASAGILSRGLISGLEKRYPGARIEISPSIRWTVGQPPDRITNVALLEESGNGEVHLRVSGESSDLEEAPTSHSATAEGYASFSAYVSAWVASRRVFPNEKLDVNAFTKQEVNVASGQYRDMRGLIVAANAEDSLASLQSRQTLLEGGVLLSSAVERIPDVRRGDAIRINLVSGGLTLTVPGVAEEPAYLNGHVRVMTNQTKRELLGELEPGGIVEVRL